VQEIVDAYGRHDDAQQNDEPPEKRRRS
jgi:hypothetical protein